MTKQDIITAFDVIAMINNLTKVDGTINIYVDPSGVRFYLDKYGFHTVNQFSNHKLQQQQVKLHMLYSTIVGSVIPKELLGKKTKGNLRTILESSTLTNDQKISSIVSIVYHIEPQEIRIKDRLEELLSRYITG